MLKNIAKFEKVINGRLFTFLCETDSPLADCKEFDFELFKYICEIEYMVRAKQSEEKKDQPEEVKDVSDK